MALPAELRVAWLCRTLDFARSDWDGRSNGGGPRLMPSTYTLGSYAELEAQLARLRETSSTSRAVWWSLSARYRWGSEERIVVPLRATRGLRDPTPVLPPCTRLVSDGQRLGKRKALALVYRWDERVDERLAELGLAVLARLMYRGRGGRGRIVLPDVVLAAVAGRSP